MKKIFVLMVFLLFLSLGYAQTYYIQNSTNSSYGNIPLLHTNELKIGNSSLLSERQKNMIKIGDNSYIQIGEWEANNTLSFKATKYSFTNGYVGIGTATPTHLLDVNGTIAITGSSHFIFGNSSGHGVINFGNNGAGDLYFRSLPVGNNINNFNQLMILTNDGRLGIGTWDPGTYKLAVNGSIRAKSIKVDTGWADFVFDNDYKLLNIYEVEKFIAFNKHLPDMPSAKEVEENGVNLGEMQSKLLQKIEELTLYIINLQNQVDELNLKLNTLENQTH